jgi:tetratricopeptide (TPR) repeat protein
MKQSYPRMDPAYINEADVLGRIGEFQKAIDNQLEAIRLDPDTVNAYLSGANNYRALGRFDEAKALLNQAVQRKIGGTQIHLALARTAVTDGDIATANREWEAAKASPQGKMRVQQAQISMAGAQGQIGRVRKMTMDLVDDMKRSELGPLTAGQMSTLADLESDFGYSQRAIDAANAALQMDQSWDVKMDVASILAHDGDEKKAQALAAEVAKERPLDTLVQSVSLPALRAEIDLRHKNPTGAIQDLALELRRRIGWLMSPRISTTSTLWLSLGWRAHTQRLAIRAAPVPRIRISSLFGRTPTRIFLSSLLPKRSTRS